MAINEEAVMADARKLPKRVSLLANFIKIAVRQHVTIENDYGC